jgi:hypothetical protein
MSEQVIPPLAFNWDAARSVMVPRQPKLADKVFTDCQFYRLGVIEERSGSSHNHYFAALNEAWSNLPDDLAERFPTSEHLRKFALIKTGYADQHTLACSSKAEALRIAAFLKPVDEFSVIVVRDATVTRYTARSQSNRAMGAKDFQLSKAAVLDFVATLIGTSTRELEQAGANA